eukprot:scaffold210175_cov24-Tisochrysis_lutea.AAC.3
MQQPWCVLNRAMLNEGAGRLDAGQAHQGCSSKLIWCFFISSDRLGRYTSVRTPSLTTGTTWRPSPSRVSRESNSQSSPTK